MMSSLVTVLILFLWTFLLSVALAASKDQLQAVVTRSLLGRSLLLNFLIIPLWGLFVPELFNLSSEFALGFFMVSLTPGGLLALHFSRLAKGNLIYAVGVILGLSILSILVTPVLFQLRFPELTGDPLAVLPLLGQFLLVIAVPLALAAAIRQYWSQAIQKLQKITSILSIVFFLTLTILTSNLPIKETERLDWDGLMAIALFILGAWGLGWLFGGPDIATRKVLAISTSLRNVVICFLIVSGGEFHPQTQAMLIGFNTLVVPMNLIAAIALGRLTQNQSND